MSIAPKLLQTVYTSNSLALKRLDLSTLVGGFGLDAKHKKKDEVVSVQVPRHLRGSRNEKDYPTQFSHDSTHISFLKQQLQKKQCNQELDLVPILPLKEFEMEKKQLHVPIHPFCVKSLEWTSTLVKEWLQYCLIQGSEPIIVDDGKNNVVSIEKNTPRLLSIQKVMRYGPGLQYYFYCILSTSRNVHNEYPQTKCPDYHTAGFCRQVGIWLKYIDIIHQPQYRQYLTKWFVTQGSLQKADQEYGINPFKRYDHQDLQKIAMTVLCTSAVKSSGKKKASPKSGVPFITEKDFIPGFKRRRSFEIEKEYMEQEMKKEQGSLVKNLDTLMEMHKVHTKNYELDPLHSNKMERGSGDDQLVSKMMEDIDPKTLTRMLFTEKDPEMDDHDVEMEIDPDLLVEADKKRAQYAQQFILLDSNKEKTPSVLWFFSKDELVEFILMEQAIKQGKEFEHSEQFIASIQKDTAKEMYTVLQNFLDKGEPLSEKETDPEPCMITDENNPLHVLPIFSFQVLSSTLKPFFEKEQQEKQAFRLKQAQEYNIDVASVKAEPKSSEKEKIAKAKPIEIEGTFTITLNHVTFGKNGEKNKQDVEIEKEKGKGKGKGKGKTSTKRPGPASDSPTPPAKRNRL